jgi:hypothetical protein
MFMFPPVFVAGMVHRCGGIVQPPIDKRGRLPHSRGMRVLASFAFLALTGCVVGTIAETAVDVAVIPVKVASAGVDAVTTSQSEADEKRGRELREAEARCRKGKPRPEDDCTRVRPR